MVVCYCNIDPIQGGKMIFALKRGRPKNEVFINEIREMNEANMIKSARADVLQSLFLLKKITKEQNEAAKFYQKLRGQYHNSIESPNLATSSFLKIETSRTVIHSTQKDEIICRIWNELKIELKKVDKSCEEIIQKVVIENKMKYELLNPTNIAQNSLRLLQQGLDSITAYKAKLGKYLISV